MKADQEIDKDISNLKVEYSKMKKRIIELKRIEKRYYEIFENIKEGLFKTTVDGMIIDLNLSFVKMLGYNDKEEFFNQVENIRVIYLDQNELDKVIGILREKKEIVNYLLKFKRKDQEIITISLNSKIILDEENNTEYIEGSIADVSKDLEKENKLNSEKIAAEKANKIKSQFLVNMGHDMRTPMNGIVGMVEMLKGTELSDVQKKYLDNVEFASDNLLKIVNELLDISKIESGDIELSKSEFNMETLVEKISQSFLRKANLKNVELSYYVEDGIPRVLLGDKEKIRKILFNLIENSIKFTNKGEIYIGVKKLWEDSKKIQIQIYVKDTGSGINLIKKPDIFEFFDKGEYSYTKIYEGIGLGLSISKKLVKLMGGDISFFSIENEGTKFYFDLYLEKMKIKLYEEKEDKLCKLKILVIDQSKLRLGIIRKILEDKVKILDDFINLKEALKVIKKDYYDIIILDITAFDFEDLMEIKSMKKIILKSIDEKEKNDKIKGCRIDEFLIKPIKRKDLINKIKVIMKVENVGKNIEEIKLKENTILLAEDNEINAMTVTLFLERKGYKVILAENGLEALDKLSENKIDLILMDIQMPVMNGVEAVKEIRKKEEYKELPIIAFTAYAMKGDRENFINSGMNDYISKPVNPNLLYKKIEILLEKD